MPTKRIRTTEDILKLLSNAVQRILSFATGTEITYSPMIQRINKTCLKPDIGCFVLFDGVFSGLVVINFSAPASIELYRSYMLNMGMPEEELSTLHTSDDVNNTLGELMNQIVGNFAKEVRQELGASLFQSQPRMIVINQELILSISTHIERPQYRKVSFETASHHPFFLEFCMEKAEFIDIGTALAGPSS